MKKIIFVAGVFALSSVLSCSHPTLQPESPRSPAAEQEPKVEAEILSSEEISGLNEMVANKNGERLSQLFNGIRMSQILVASFDARLAKLQTEEDTDKLLTSNLYCKILELRPLHEKIEEKIAAAYSYSEKNEMKDWFYQELMVFAKKDPMNEIAAIQILRSLNAKADVAALNGFHVAPFDDEAFADFTTKNQRVYDKIAPSDLRPGLCFGDLRQPNADGAYDWKNRNWTGSTLPKGQFVFTYDDGPHPTLTNIIRSTWAKAGMAKPTFFWVMHRVSGLPKLVQEVSGDSYMIGSHSDRHADLGTLARSTAASQLNAVDKKIFGPELSKISASQYDAWKTKTLNHEINEAVANLSSTIGKPIRFYRLPYGSGTKNDLIGARFQALNLDHFFWRVDSLDWQDKNPASIRNRVVAQMKNVGSGIILFHDTHPQSAQAAQLMVDYLKANTNYKAVNVMDIPGLKK